MKENEFDIYVRNLMAGAEEPVSPDVWKGVEAGLDRTARPSRTVPMWLWRSLAGTGIAAAVAAAFVLLRPSENLSNQPTIQTPVALEATDAPLPAVTTPEGDDVTPVAEQAARLRSRIAYVPEPAVPVVTEETAESGPDTAAEDTPYKPDAVIAPTAPRQESFTSDEEAFRQLAFEEHKTYRKGQLSVSILGNLQSNTRPESPSSTVRRTSPLFLAPNPTKSGIYDERPEFSFGLPVSGGITFRYDFTPRWGIGTGIVYTNLSRSYMGNYFEVEDGGEITKRLYDTDINNQMHYVGIPVNLLFNIVNNGGWNFHVRLDGMAEKLVDNHFIVHDSEGDIHLHQNVDPLQFSAGVGVGVEFKFTPNLGIYFDPTLRYYFDCGQPRSLRTIQPLRMDFEAGVRLSLGR